MTESLLSMSGLLEAEDDFNLTIVHCEDSILMGRKMRGFGKGKLVLPGGKTRYSIGESGIYIIPFEEEAAREATEETGIPLIGALFEQTGVLHIADEIDTRTIRIYKTRVVARTATHSDELSDLNWHPADALPYGEMPQDYGLWLPHILAGYAVTAFFETNSDQIVDAKIFRQRLNPLERAEEVFVELRQ